MRKILGAKFPQRLCCVRQCRRPSTSVCDDCGAPFCSLECRDLHVGDGLGNGCRSLPRQPEHENESDLQIITKKELAAACATAAGAPVQRRAGNSQNNSSCSAQNSSDRRLTPNIRSLSGRDSEIRRNEEDTRKYLNVKTEGQDGGLKTASLHSPKSRGSRTNHGTTTKTSRWPPNRSYAPIVEKFASFVPTELATLVCYSPVSSGLRNGNGEDQIQVVPKKFRAMSNVKEFYRIGEEVVVIPTHRSIVTGFVSAILLPADARRSREFLEALHAALSPPSSAGEQVSLYDCAVLELVYFERLGTLHRGIVVGDVGIRMRFLINPDSGANISSLGPTTKVWRVHPDYRLPAVALPLVLPVNCRDLFRENTQNLRMVLEKGFMLRSRRGDILKVLDWDDAALVPHCMSSIAAIRPLSADADDDKVDDAAVAVEAILVGRMSSVVKFLVVGASERASLRELRENLREIGGVCSKTGKGCRLQVGGLGFTVDSRYKNPRRFIVNEFAENNQMKVEFIDDGGTGLVDEKSSYFLPMSLLKIPPFVREFKIVDVKKDGSEFVFFDKYIALRYRVVIRVFGDTGEQIDVSFGRDRIVTGKLLKWPPPAFCDRLEGGPTRSGESRAGDEVPNRYGHEGLRICWNPTGYGGPKFPEDVKFRELKAGSVVTVSVLGIPSREHGGHYWGYDFGAAPVSELDQVRSALASMDGEAQNAALAAAPVESPKRGDVVLAMDDVDNKFKRAFVGFGNSVSFLDTGATAEVKPTGIRQIPPSLLASPAAANLFVIAADDGGGNVRPDLPRILDSFRCQEPFLVELKVLSRLWDNVAVYFAEILALNY